MHRRDILLGGLGLALSGTASAGAIAQQGGGKSVALLIGVEEYENPDISRLRYAVKDVTSIGALLEKTLGYATVRVMTSDTRDVRLKPTNINIIKALDAVASEVSTDDTFLLYFSGHGFSKQGQSFLGSMNVDPDSIETLRLSAVPVADLQSKLKKVRAKQVIVIMDACRNDPEAGKGDGDNKLTGDLAKSLGLVARSASESGGGSAMLFACSEGERAFEEPGFEHSVFTHYLLEGLSGKAGTLGVEDVVSYTAGEVAKWAKTRGKKQTPDHIRFGTGKLAFGSVAVAPKPFEPKVELAATSIRLELLGVPTGATIKVDDAPLNGTIYTDEIADKTKDVEISISANSFHPYVGKVTLTRGSVSTLRVTMERKATEPVVPVKPVVPSRLTDYPALRAYVESLRPIPAGTFEMGSSTGDSDEKPVHRVTLSAFRMGATPVTVAVWKEYCAATGTRLPEAPEWGLLDEHPVVNVSRGAVGGFCGWASDIVGFRLSLPTEAQFEYASRGGQSGLEYSWGNTFDDSKVWSSVVTKRLGTAAVNRTSNVFRNAFSLTDMSGNVWQWCSDLSRPDLPDSQADPVGQSAISDNKRWVRGGSWGDNDPDTFRCANRYGLNLKVISSTTISFRLAAGSGSDEAVSPGHNTKQQYPSRFALILANQSYEKFPLTFINNDASLMARTLTSLGFKVSTLVDGTESTMRSKLIEFNKNLSSKPGSIGLVYYSGQGLRVSGEDYLVPVNNGNIVSKSDARASCLSIANVLELSQGKQVSNLIAIFDSSREDPFTSDDAIQNCTGKSDLAIIGQLPFVAFATGVGQTATANGTNSLFTKVLSDELMIAGRTFEDVIIQTGYRVSSLSGGKQRPEYRGKCKHVLTERP